MNRIRLLWQAMRQPVIDRFPDAPGLPQDVKAYLKRVNDVYVTDAYHSLSIEGYQVTPELIERVRTGSWNPERNDSDREQRNAMAARHDAEERQRQQELAAAMQQLQQDQGVPTTEAGNTPPMTLAQRSAIYGESPNAPQHTSNVSEAQAEAKQKRLSIEKQQQDALNSDTVAIDFSHTGTAATPVAVQAARAEGAEKESAEEIGGKQAPKDGAAKAEPISAYPFDQFQGQLYRVFEGTVLEGVLTNHVDGGLSGPILVMLTTDYYSHDHQQLLMPQGTRLIGSVQSVGNAQQRKMFVTFHRAVCPDGFSLDFDKYLGLDQIGKTGLATKVDHGYLLAFGAAAAIGGLGGLAQIGNNGSVFTPSTEIRNGISEQSAAEGEQVLNHFLNRLPIITLKEGSRARIYIGRDILIPSYAAHRVEPRRCVGNRLAMPNDE